MKKDRFKMMTISANNSDFPIKIRYDNRPELLYYKGNLDQRKPRIAIVGTRKASAEGLKIAENLSKNLASAGIIIVSGLAIGIDSAAHKGALATNGITWAVLGSSLDKIYPSSNVSLANKILESGGVLLTEYSEKDGVYRSNFLNRNRIIASISDAVIIVEAPIKSGAISTAAFALKHNIPTFVVPGSILSKNYAGSNMLLRKGGVAITSWKDVIRDLNIDAKTNLSGNTGSNTNILDENKQIIFSAINKSGGSATIDIIVEKTTLSPNEVASELSELEIIGLIEKIGNKYIIKK